MSIRRRIFLSYIILICIVVFYSLLLLFFGIFERRIDDDIADLYQSKEVWNDLLLSMNDFQINWSDGETFLLFKEKAENLEVLLKEMPKGADQHFFTFQKNLGRRKTDLYNTWSVARGSVWSIIEIVDSPEFQDILRPLEKRPGLQRLNHLWIELYYSSDQEAQKEAYVLRQVIDKIEFFPIYSETLNHLFNVIIHETDHLTSSLKMVRLFITVLFFILFILLYLVLAIRFSGSLSEPIITLSLELSAFMGKTLKLDHDAEREEVELLSRSVKNLITHYTDLSELAGHLAQGEVDSSILELQELGVVGNALKEINLYIRELAEASQWIREGKYGAKIRVKSDKDILADNFNIMSQVIYEQITTLRNVFEAVDEGILVADHEGAILEANTKFLQLTHPGCDKAIDLEEKTMGDFFGKMAFPDDFLNHLDNDTVYTNITDIRGNSIPVKVITRKMADQPDQKEKLMLFITNESVRFRMEREKEKFKAQAVEAELRALRAQINPHFLFNTLNGIAHLVESGRDGAVLMLEKLSDLFRYTLFSTRKNTVKLSEELDIIKQFLDIEKMRFGDDLTVEYHIDQRVTHNSIPPMLLQPVVENAVKYGADENGKIHVAIHTMAEDGVLIITISDRGYQVVNHHLLLEQKGTGIKNVNHRLLSLYNNTLQFAQNEPQGLQVIIKIPEMSLL